MREIYETLAHTPWWVYVLLVVLVRRGLAARQPGVHGFSRLLIMPLLFTLWGIWEMITVLHPGAALVLAWLVAVLVGAAIGQALVRGISIRADHAHWLIGRPGDMSLLPIALISFAVKYAFAYALGVNPGLAHSSAYAAGDIIASGLISGVFIGKLAVYWFKFRAAPSETLTETPRGSRTT